MKKFKKLLLTSLITITIAYSASTCAEAHVESLSVIDNTLYAQVNAENARLYVAGHSEGLLVDAFFSDIAPDGKVELPIGEASEYNMYLWDRDSLAPISSAYVIKNGRAYASESGTAIPEYNFTAYSFNQEDDVMIVSAITDTEIKGFKAGVETTYALTDSVAVLGLSDKIADVVPGSVVLIGTNQNGSCAAIELLATIGIPVTPQTFIDDFGTYAAADGSEKYQNIVNEMFSKSGTEMSIFRLDENGNVLKDENDSALTTKYKFASSSILCYRVGIAMSGDTPIITLSSSKISATKYSTPKSVIEGTNTHHNYLYLRYNTETERITQCVLYCVPKNFNPNAGDEEYSPIFSLKPIVIIE